MHRLRSEGLAEKGKSEARRRASTVLLSIDAITRASSKSLEFAAMKLLLVMVEIQKGE